MPRAVRSYPPGVRQALQRAREIMVSITTAFIVHGVVGFTHNYDGELAARLDVLASRSNQRLMYIFDSTSPIEASERFCRSTTRERMRFRCDGELGSCIAT